MPDINLKDEEDFTEDSNTGQDKPEKYLEFFDKNGLKTSVAVFKGESEQDALARARAIDARLGKKPTF